MRKEQIIKKLTSRKFIVAVISIISGICLLLGADSDTVSIISGGAMIILPTIAYCLVEGKIDAENVKTIVTTLEETINTLDDIKKSENDFHGETEGEDDE